MCMCSTFACRHILYMHRRSDHHTRATSTPHCFRRDDRSRLPRRILNCHVLSVRILYIYENLNAPIPWQDAHTSAGPAPPPTGPPRTYVQHVLYVHHHTHARIYTPTPLTGGAHLRHHTTHRRRRCQVPTPTPTPTRPRPHTSLHELRSTSTARKRSDGGQGCARTHEPAGPPVLARGTLNLRLFRRAARARAHGPSPFTDPPDPKLSSLRVGLSALPSLSVRSGHEILLPLPIRALVVHGDSVVVRS